MRRRVAPEKRKRAEFSCDRCRTRKTKCVRVATDGTAAALDSKELSCRGCAAVGAPCITSTPRRRRVYGSIETLGSHYQAVLSLVQGLYPNVDTNDIGELNRLGADLGISMDPEVAPSPIRPFQPTRHAVVAPSEMAEFSETLIYDQSGGSHYVGTAGTSSLFKILCNLLLKRSSSHQLSFDKRITLFRSSAERRPNYRQTCCQLLKEPKFPLLQLAEQQYAEKLVMLFLEKVHPFLFIFEPGRLRQWHQKFWQKIHGEEINDLQSIEMGCIYLVWLITSRNLSLHSTQVDFSRIDEILQLILIDASLGASTASVQFLYLYATYLHSNKNRDASWNLVGLAIRQSMSLGLHRKMCTLANAAQLFWSLYQFELTLCANFGRQSNINEDEIDIEYPDLTHMDVPSEFKAYHTSMLSLTRFLSKIVKERRLTTYQQTLSLINIERTLLMKSQLLELGDGLEIMPVALIASVYDFKLNLLYHHYMASLTLPFLVHTATTNYNIRDDETLLSIVQVGLQSSITIAKLMQMCETRNFHNGAISNDCIVGYNCALCLSLFCIYLCNSSNDTWELLIKLDGQEVRLDRVLTLDYISMISDFMTKHKLDSTTSRMSEVVGGFTKDLQLVVSHSDAGFDMLTFEPDNLLVYESLFLNNDIYMDSYTGS